MLGGRVGRGGGGGAAAGRVAVRLVSKGQGAERFATYILHAMILPINFKERSVTDPVTIVQEQHKPPRD